MRYPEFFDTVKPVKLQDPLAAVLGAFEKGEYEISYIEVVKAAGHSCPTVAGAYLMAQKAIEVLYDGQRGVRGDIKVAFAEELTQGVAGVIANVISHITGATDKSGFKGLNGKFARHSLMDFEANIESSARFTRVSTGRSIDIFYNHNVIPQNPQMPELMKKMFAQQATPQEAAEFAKIWQERVATIFQNVDKVLEVREV